MQFLMFFVSLTLSALLFAVQPMASKMLLPVLGGTPAVWTTAMFTFQLLLLAGYFYAHVLVRLLKPRCACMVHGAFFVASLTLLPIAVTLASGPDLLAMPAPYVIAALVLQVGLPFLLLSATQPLLQAWLVNSRHPLAAHAHVLYSASNLGSFIGLIGYVALAEPLLTLSQQRMGWSLAYVVGLLLMLLIGGKLVRLQVATAEKPTEERAKPVCWQNVGAWIGLAFLASSLSLGVTTYVTTDVASMPLIWVIPLALYLLSFVDAFRLRPRLVPFCQRFGPLLGLVALFLYGVQAQRFSGIYLYHFFAFGVLALALHGWLVALRPRAGALTGFYLCMSIGGALGGLLNGFLAPLLLRDALEYPVVLISACLVLQMLLSARERGVPFACEQKTLWRVVGLVSLSSFFLYFLFNQLSAEKTGAGIALQTLLLASGVGGIVSLILQRGYHKAFYAAATMLTILIFGIVCGGGETMLYKDRNFFGIQRVWDSEEMEARFLTHDTTVHGVQSLRVEDRLNVVSYYSALRELFLRVPRVHTLPIATIGLGVGTSKCYLQTKQHMDFFEINPMVQQIAEDPHYFTYLSDCPGTHQLWMGDGRIRLAEQPNSKYGLLVLDAFSSDAIPAHLLTREALDLYFSKLMPHGVMAFNTTNRHINLWPVIGVYADAAGYVAYGKHFNYPENTRLKFRSFWVVMAREEADLAPLVTKEEGWQPLHGDAGSRVWTDQYVSILPYLKVIRGDNGTPAKP